MFGRTGTVAVLLILQIALVLLVNYWLAEYFRWFAVGQTVFSVVMIFYLFNSGMDNSAKLTWLNLIMLFPVPGTLFLLFTKPDADR